MEDINYIKIFKKTKKRYKKFVKKYYRVFSKSNYIASFEKYLLEHKMVQFKNILDDLEEKAYYQDKMEKGIYQEEKRSKRK